jgi:hypothetical protein
MNFVIARIEQNSLSQTHSYIRESVCDLRRKIFFTTRNRTLKLQ